MNYEVWDAYDRHLNRIPGETLVRGEPIPEGMYHLVSDVIVRHTDGSWLLMQRDRRKNWGGMWEATAGGSALRGESAYACAERELAEETGIRDAELEQVGILISHVYHTIFAEYLCVTDQPKDTIVLQDGETQAYKWVTTEELRQMKRDDLITERMQGFLQELR